jgi:hypothetical protein
MLKHITYTLPNNTPDNLGFFKQLIELLTKLPNAHTDENGSLIITPSNPVQALPTTVFKQSNTPLPQLYLGSSQAISLDVGNLRINPNSTIDYKVNTGSFDRVLAKHDVLGEYFEIHVSSETFYRLPMNELVKRFKDHIVRIDHTGINIPSVLISEEAWKLFIHTLAGQANLYKYPAIDVWPFILPATQKEHQTDITQFPAGREPKFELVYDIYSPVPTIQVDVETDLTRSEVERLLPEPYGISFPDLADFFRTVYVHHLWPGLAIRFDIRFKSDQPSDWETGRWLVNEGGRVRSSEASHKSADNVEGFSIF